MWWNKASKFLFISAHHHYQPTLAVGYCERLQREGFQQSGFPTREAFWVIVNIRWAQLLAILWCQPLYPQGGFCAPLSAESSVQWWIMWKHHQPHPQPKHQPQTPPPVSERRLKLEIWCWQADEDLSQQARLQSWGAPNITGIVFCFKCHRNNHHGIPTTF